MVVVEVMVEVTERKKEDILPKVPATSTFEGF